MNGTYVDVTREGSRIVNLGYLTPEDELLLQCEVISGDVESCSRVYTFTGKITGHWEMMQKTSGTSHLNFSAKRMTPSS